MADKGRGEVVTYIDAITIGLREEMERDSRVWCLGEDIGVYGGAFKVTKGFVDKFGEKRVLDTPLSESAIIGVAIGSALNGMIPVAEMQFADFITSGFNQIVNQAAKMHYRYGAPVPMVVRCPTGGGVHGGPFHSQNPEMWFVKTPGLKVVEPSTPYDAYGLIKAAIRDPNPVIFFEHKYLYRRIKERLPDEEYVVEIGKADIKREGSDITVVTYGSMVHFSLEAAEILSKEGVEVEIVDLRTLLPIDKEAVLKSVRKTGKLCTIHEDTLTAGMGGEISAIVAEHAFDSLDAPIKRIAAIDTPVPYAPPLEEFFSPNTDKILKALRELAAY